MEKDPLSVLVKSHDWFELAKKIGLLLPRLTFTPDPKRLKHKGTFAVQLPTGKLTNQRFFTWLEAYNWAEENYRGRFWPNGKVKFTVINTTPSPTN